jgi:hypothetical protein
MSERTEPAVTINLSLDEARRISNGLSDLALWCHGFNAALSQEESSRRPWGTESLSDINLKIKAAIKEPF